MPVRYFCAILCPPKDLNLGFPLPEHLIRTLPPRNLHISSGCMPSFALVQLFPRDFTKSRQEENLGELGGRAIVICST